MPFADWTSFRNFVFEFCNRRNQYIQNNFDHFLTAGTWRFIKSCLPLGGIIDYAFATSDFPNPILETVFIRIGDYYMASLQDLIDRGYGIPYAIENIKGYESDKIISIPYWKVGQEGLWWDSGKKEILPAFWTFHNATSTPQGYISIYYPSHELRAVLIRALWLPSPFALQYRSILWQQYPYEIAKFTYYEVLLALSEWDEANMVWQECMKIAQEMRQQHGAKKLIIPYQQIDYLNPQTQVVVGGGGGGE